MLGTLMASTILVASAPAAPVQAQSVNDVIGLAEFAAEYSLYLATRWAPATASHAAYEQYGSLDETINPLLIANDTECARYNQCKIEWIFEHPVHTLEQGGGIWLCWTFYNVRSYFFDPSPGTTNGWPTTGHCPHHQAWYDDTQFGNLAVKYNQRYYPRKIGTTGDGMAVYKATSFFWHSMISCKKYMHAELRYFADENPLDRGGRGEMYGELIHFDSVQKSTRNSPDCDVPHDVEGDDQ